MALQKPAFKELAAAMAEELASVAQRPTFQADATEQPCRSLTSSHAERDVFPQAIHEILEDQGEVLVDDWLEAQLLDCQNLARRHGLVQLSKILDEALDVLSDERKQSAVSLSDWRARSHQ
jgi:hypothetical protein